MRFDQSDGPGVAPEEVDHDVCVKQDRFAHGSLPIPLCTSCNASTIGLFPITSIISLRPALLADRLTRRRSRSKTLVKFVKDVPHYIVTVPSSPTGRAARGRAELRAGTRGPPLARAPMHRLLSAQVLPPEFHSTVRYVPPYVSPHGEHLVAEDKLDYPPGTGDICIFS